jgi:hypothetical protein
VPALRHYFVKTSQKLSAVPPRRDHGTDSFHTNNLEHFIKAGVTGNTIVVGKLIVVTLSNLVSSQSSPGDLPEDETEVLDETLNKSSIESFKAADMYAFGLVLWEITRRTLTGDKVAQCDDYQLPYYDCVPSDPSFDEMFQVVCVKGIRPVIPSRWNSTELLRSFYKIMSECWHQDSSVRLTALRVKKSLSRLESDIVNPDGGPMTSYP